MLLHTGRNTVTEVVDEGGTKSAVASGEGARHVGTKSRLALINRIFQHENQVIGENALVAGTYGFPPPRTSRIVKCGPRQGPEKVNSPHRTNAMMPCLVHHNDK